jgi:hypothetical protein
MKTRKAGQWVARLRQPMIHWSNWSLALKEEPAGVANCPIQELCFSAVSLFRLCQRRIALQTHRWHFMLLKLLKAALFIGYLPASQRQAKTDFGIRTLVSLIFANTSAPAIWPHSCTAFFHCAFLLICLSNS